MLACTQGRVTMRCCPGAFGALAIDVLVRATWRWTWHGWFWAHGMQKSGKTPKKTTEAAIPKGNEKSQFVCLLPVPHQMARNASRCPSGNT